ncbi:MAG: glycosyltransferase family 4 protein [Candidatus Deferrimicrobium sp.]
MSDREYKEILPGGGLSVFMVCDIPGGAYFHYCSQLCNALVEQAGIAGVRLTAVFGGSSRAGILPEEKELLHPKVEAGIIIRGPGSKIRRYLGFLLSFFGLKKRIRRSATCIHVHTTTGLESLDLLLLFLFWWTGLPVIRTVHEVTAAERSRPPTGFQRWMGRLHLKMADAIIVHDERTRELLQGFNGMQGARITVIPHGNYLVFSRLGKPEGKVPRPNPIPVVLFFGIKRNKGIEVFFRALRELQDEGYPVRSLIAGRITPGDEDLFDSIGGLKNVEVKPGYIPDRDLWRVYDACDMVAFPYLRGTTSGAIHLAYAFKRPVIVSDLECFRDIVIHGKTGLVVPRGDSGGLADAIRQMCQDPDARTRMGEEGYRLACSDRYGWDSIARRTVGVYRDAFVGKRSRT